jgi:hypothetical protein
VYLLCAAAALVAIGGIYLLIQVKASGAAAPSGNALVEANRRARPSPSTARPHREDTQAIPKPERTGDAPLRRPPSVAPDIGEAVRTAALEPAPAPNKDSDVDADFELAMAETNKLYDRQQFDEARTLALKLLERKPGTVRMLRVVVSSSCILGDADMAQRYWRELPEFDQGQMSTRCDRFDIKFKQ